MASFEVKPYSHCISIEIMFAVIKLTQWMPDVKLKKVGISRDEIGQEDAKTL